MKKETESLVTLFGGRKRLKANENKNEKMKTQTKVRVRKRYKCYIIFQMSNYFTMKIHCYNTLSKIEIFFDNIGKNERC